MSLYLDGIVDPVAAQGKRQLNFVPKHFHVVALSDNYFFDKKVVTNWIWRNQSGRFAVANRVKIEDKRLVSETIAAFEDSSEAIMFSFIVPTLKNNGFDDFI